ncbi:MAG: tetratricopeptide repeat protein [Clostridia bacterium]|nr:tetratricopeptide repeat protein [Clostridia bacterium]
MGSLNCKMCGGALNVNVRKTVTICAYCGTRQSLPRLGDEGWLAGCEEANTLRRNGDFSGAEAVYERLIRADATDSEPYWGMLLCRFGIRYVENPETKQQVQVVSRVSETSVMEDEYYRQAVQLADLERRELYEAEAKVIEAVRQKIVAHRPAPQPQPEPQPPANGALLMRQGYDALEEGNFTFAEACFNQVLKQTPNNARAHLGALLAEMQLRKLELLAVSGSEFQEHPHFQQALQYADPSLASSLRALLAATEGAAEAKKEPKKRSGLKWTLIITAIVLLLGAAAAAAYFFFLMPASKYNKANDHLKQGKYAEAIVLLEELGDYKSAEKLLEEAYYQQALQRMRENDYEKAVDSLLQVQDQALQLEYFEQARLHLQSYAGKISAGRMHTVGVKKDGTVLSAGDNTAGQRNVGEWTDIVAVAAGDQHTVGLKKNGTVVAVGDNAHGQCNTAEWTDIVAIAAGSGHTVGLKKNGTVVAVGYNANGECAVSEWKGVTCISVGANHTVGLKKDGSVVATGLNDKQQCSVTTWKNIAAVVAGRSHTVGLKLDGTAVAIGMNEQGQCNTEEWEKIIDAAAGYGFSFGLRIDGRVSFVNTGDWKDIVSVAAGSSHAVAMDADGNVFATGSNEHGQCDVQNWNLL